MAEEIKFEKAMERLEKIVEDLEAGEISLEEALKKYEEGVQLSGICQKKLGQAEKKIEILNRALDGSLTKESFEYDEDGERAGPSSAPKKKSKKASLTSKTNLNDDEDLLL
ncbi:MAG: exodeoxyribonuclease VII small subunit [Candidatus Omnitrophica bacterium]|nr:exodeoxyribonuclease VII small subunit [Candidatus Omnitrophota bacterium]